MRPFMDENFLLRTDAARELYFDAARNMPILDYHCHLNPREIADNIAFEDLARLFLGGDHYKWRIMLADGADESLIRGAGDGYQKFLAFARALRGAIGNPLYHWTHLELRRVFGIDVPLTEDAAPAIWAEGNRLLRQSDFRAQGLIDRFRVDTLCTTDDPADDLGYHAQIQSQGTLRARVLPAFRPDKAVNIHRPGFTEYIGRLSRAAGLPIRAAGDVLAALESRADYFHARGARLSDHALDTVPGGAIDEGLADAALRAALRGEGVSPEQADAYRVYILTQLGGIYAARGWAQQYHMAALRDNNARMLARFGPDTGFDSMLDAPIACNLSRLLDAQETLGALPRTILYSLNAASAAVVATMAGNFQQSGVPGKVQMGAAWWFLDQRDGMEEQLRTLAAMGLLSRFVGMLTDSRSFISYPRHEYFRRILCNLLGGWVEAGEYPPDMDYLKTVVRGICFDNAKAYFNM